MCLSGTCAVSNPVDIRIFAAIPVVGGETNCKEDDWV